jgi:hypothetical protein
MENISLLKNGVGKKHPPSNPKKRTDPSERYGCRSMDPFFHSPGEFPCFLPVLMKEDLHGENTKTRQARKVTG